MRDNRLSTPLAVLLLLGMFFPSSFSGAPSHTLDGILTVLVMLIFARIIWSKDIASPSMILISVAIPLTFVVSTLISNLPEIRAGVIVYFLLTATMYCLNLRDLPMSKTLQWLFLTTNVVCVAAGILLAAGNESLGNFVIAHYSAYYADLVPTMLEQHKPVLVFGTHSFAAFMLYLFFLLNWRSFVLGRGRIYGILAACYFGLIISLVSFSAVLFGTIALSQMSMHLWKRHRRIALTAFVLVLLLIPKFISLMDEQLGGVGVMQALDSFLHFEVSGPTGRFGTQGTLSKTIAYIGQNPFAPIGMGHSSKITYGDSGPIEYVLRGSLPLLALMYGGYFLFLKRNLTSCYDYRFLFGVTVLFETGFAVLTQLRFLAVLPFFLVYLNSLSGRVESGTAP